MGRRATWETFVAVMDAFARQRTWTQGELARDVGIGVESLREFLLAVESSGHWGLEREEDHPHVYWSVPEKWHPAGLVVSHKDAVALTRELVRAPETTERNRLLDVLTRGVVGLPDLRGVVHNTALTAEQATWMRLLEDAAREHRVVVMTHQSDGDPAPVAGKVVSPQRVYPAQRKFMAWKHGDGGGLRWYRLDRVHHARADESQAWVHVETAALDRLAHESADGFHDGEAPREAAFVIRAGDTAWAVKNVPVEDKDVTPVGGGYRVVVRTSGMNVVARYLAGLGDAVTIESDELRRDVLAIAQGAVKAHARRTTGKTRARSRAKR